MIINARGRLMRPLVVSYWHCCLLYCQNLRAFLAELRYNTDGQPGVSLTEENVPNRG